MKKYFLLLVFCLGLVWCHNIRAQELLSQQNDSLNIFFANKDWKSYFRKISKLGLAAYTEGNTTQISELSEYLKKDFGILDTTERKELRGAAMRIGSKIWKLTGDSHKALDIYLIAHNNVQNIKTLDTLAWYIENVISNLYTRIGDYEKAEYYAELSKSSLSYYHENEWLSRCYTNLGTILESQLKPEQAIGAFRRGYYLADSIHYISGTFGNAISLANLFNEMHSLDSADIYLKRAGEQLSQLNSDKGYLEKKSGFEIESGDLKIAQGKCAESIPLYKEGIHTLAQYYPNTERREFAKYYTSFANAYLCAGSLDTAILNINLGIACLSPEFKENDLIPTQDQIYPENSFVNLLELKAQIYEKQFSISADVSNLEKALACIERALDVNDLIRETVIADPSKLISIRSNKVLIEKGVSILFQLKVENSDYDYFRQTRSLFNRSKSILYNDKTERNMLIQILSALDKDQWRTLQDSLSKWYESKFVNGGDINMINGKILEVQEKIDNIFAAYRTDEFTVSEPTSYIEYFITEDYIYSLSNLDGQKDFLKIGSYSEYLKLGNRLNEYICQKSLSIDDSILKDLFQFLIKPIREILPANLVIIPDGVIGFVPFEMLRSEDGKYLLEKSTISYAFEYIAYQSHYTLESRSLEVYCLAPTYPLKEVKGGDVTRGSVYHLPFAKMEVNAIRDVFGDSVLVSLSSEKNDIAQHLNDTYIFHYAGHAIISDEKAYLALNNSDDPQQQLTANEIGLKHHSLELVVLSACQTGLGKIEKGEGIRSLGRSFMESGARSTVISLWNVNDKSTALIMTAFYKYLKLGLRKDEALRQAKLEYLEQAQPRFKHPYYWGAFIPAGDMSKIKN